MSWQFLKKPTPISNKFEFCDNSLLDDDLNYSSSSWEAEKLIDTHKTIPESPNYNKLLRAIKVVFSTTEDIRQEVESKMKYIIIKNIIKDVIFENLYKTLDNLSEECKKEGFQQFSEVAKENAKKILKATYDKFPDYEYYIYPTEDREIAIDCNPQKGRGILILCDSNDSVAYFSTLDGKNSRFRCDNIEDFPYDLLWKTFKQLKEEKKYSLSHYPIKKISADKSYSTSLNIIYDSTTEEKEYSLSHYPIKKISADKSYL